jgi:uncharacterized membrane protein YdbT with pleckstrin-like domain
LKSNRLFFGLSDEELREVTDSVELFQINRGDLVCCQGADNDALWIVFSGKVCQTRIEHKKEYFIQTLEKGAPWGEDCLSGGKLGYSIHVIKNSMLIRITTPQLRAIVDRFPVLDANLQILNTSDSLINKMNLAWLQPGEEVFFAGRRHHVFLVQGLAVPVLLTLATVFLTLVFLDMILTSAPGFLAASALICFFLVCWGIWNAIDWSNDYSIVTSLRVVWMEKVALLYDSRQEAPLSTLQSIDVQTSQMGRMLGYGNIFVRTISGPLILPDVETPQEVAALIQQQLEYSKVNHRKDEIVQMEQTLRTRLNPNLAANPVISTPASVEEVLKPGFFQSFFADFFKVRYEGGGVVTYRKHWFILLQKTWKPALAATIGLLLWFGRLMDVYTFTPMLETLLLLTMVWMGVVAWWVYNYVDWRNDTYQITPDQIIDIERKPLGKEVKKVAQLDNILSIEYKRIGLMGLFLNFGTVTVAVGTSEFIFNYVYDPSRVQQDLFAKMALRQQKKKMDQLNEERERVGDYIATYHRHQDEFRTTTGKPSVSPSPEVLS